VERIFPAPQNRVFSSAPGEKKIARFHVEKGRLVERPEFSLSTCCRTEFAGQRSSRHERSRYTDFVFDFFHAAYVVCTREASLK
jgi:hypothetical protein